MACTPGGYGNAVTKSGSNQWHGDLFEFVRNGDVNAINYFAPAQDSLKRNQFGGTVGGRSVGTSYFAFGGVQETIVRQNPSGSSAFIPTAAALNGDFSALDGPGCQANGKARAIKDPASGAPLTNDFINPNRFDPAGGSISYIPSDFIGEIPAAKFRMVCPSSSTLSRPVPGSTGR